MNTWFGIGNLGKDPVLRKTNSASSVTNFTIACDRRQQVGEGDDRRTKKTADWMNVVAWNGLAEVCAKYLQKGSKVAIRGSIRPRTYTDRNGVEHNTFEINANEVEFLDRIRSTENLQVESVTTPSSTLSEQTASAEVPM